MSKGKALVTGGGGFIGTNLVKRLADEGYEVTATLHRNPPKFRDERVTYIQADLTRSEDCVRVVQGMDYVFLCAAVTSGAAVMGTNPLAHVTPNVLMNTQMLDAAYNSGVKKLLFFSSSAAYPPTGETPVRESQMFEGDPYPSYFAVGWMKRYAEVLCQMYATKVARSMATVVVRPANAYGPFDKFDFKTSHVFAALLRRVAERHRPFTVWGDGRDVKDFIYIDDLIDGTMAAFERTTQYGAYNIASGKGHTIRELLSMMLEVDDFHDVDLQFDATKPQMIPIRLIDTGLAERELGFRAKTPLPVGVKKTLEWFRSSGGFTGSGK